MGCLLELRHFCVPLKVWIFFIDSSCKARKLEWNGTKCRKISRSSWCLLYPVSASPPIFPFPLRKIKSHRGVLYSKAACFKHWKTFFGLFAFVTNTGPVCKQLSELAQVWILQDMKIPSTFNEKVQKWFLPQRLENIKYWLIFVFLNNYVVQHNYPMNIIYLVLIFNCSCETITQVFATTLKSV